MNVKYTLVSPAKNYTVIVTSPVKPEDRMKVNDAIMAKEELAEQLGFVSVDGDNAVLDMAGGEFCGNACRSAALVTGKSTIICSGTTVKAEGSAVYIPKVFQSIRFSFLPLANLESKGKRYFETKIKQEIHPAGYLFGDNANNVQVLVYIPGPNTLFWENSCASGAAYLAKTVSSMIGKAVDIDYLFPGGTIHASTGPDSQFIKIGGDIEIVKTDEIEVV